MIVKGSIDPLILSSRRRFLTAGLAASACSLPLSLTVNAASENSVNRTEQGFIAGQFGEVYYRIAGQGEVIVLLHQSAQSSAEFAQIFPLLASRYRVIMLDLPGHGHSETPPKELSIQQYSDVVIGLLNHLQIERFNLVGNHGGAVLSIDLATRFAHRIKKIIVFGLGRGEALDIEALSDEPMTRDLPIDDAGLFLQKTWQVYRKMSAAATPPHISYLPFLESLKQRQRPYDMHHAAYRWDYYPVIGDVKVPMLFVKAKEDAFAGDTKALSEKVDKGSFTEIEDAGVWVFYEKPDLCAELITNYLSTL